MEINDKERKTPGGVFFHILKFDSEIDKNLLRDIFRKDYKLYREKKKIVKILEKINLN